MSTKTFRSSVLVLFATVAVGCSESAPLRGAAGVQPQAAEAASVRSAALDSIPAAPAPAPCAVAVPSATPAAASSATSTLVSTTSVDATAVNVPFKTPAARPPKPSEHGQLRVKRLVLSEGVKDREPVGEKSSFRAADAERIYAFVEVENAGNQAAEITVSFEPPGGGPATGNVSLEVGAAPRWRTWAFTRGARNAGAWTAVVRDGRGDVLARTPFEITL